MNRAGVALLLIIMCLGGASVANEGSQADSMLPRMLQPAYQDWVNRPGEMLSFWLWTGPDTMKDQIARTGANAASFHLPMWLVEDKEAPLGVRPAPATAQVGADTPAVLEQMGVDAGVDIGEHNNACFVRYPDWFWKLRPEAAMRDRDNQVIKCGENPWPAIDDPVLGELARSQMGDMAGLLRNAKRIRYWVLGGEQGYPDYFAFPQGDYRSASRRHYTAWEKLNHLHGDPGVDKDQWYAFRDSAVADYFAQDAAHLRECDPSRPVLIPTHGNPFALDLRAKLGYPVADLAGAADGFESGPISIDDDAERIIRLTLDQQTSFGVPVAAPRLANKQLDPTATGGGRTFSPSSLRRTVYEALGLGVWHLGLVQWWGTLWDGEWGIAGTPAEAEARRVFSEIKQAAPLLDGCSRLQPQVGLFISDATWRRWWQDRWTLLYDEAVKRGWSVVLLTDAQITPDLASITPVVISVDNPVIEDKALAALSAYVKAGGKVISVGKFASGAKRTVPGLLKVKDAASGPTVKVIHQTQCVQGANTWAADVKPLPMDEIEALAAPYADLRPISVLEREPRTPSPVREAATDSTTYPLSRPCNGTGEGGGEGKLPSLSKEGPAKPGEVPERLSSTPGRLKSRQQTARSLPSQTGPPSASVRGDASCLSLPRVHSPGQGSPAGPSGTPSAFGRSPLSTGGQPGVPRYAEGVESLLLTDGTNVVVVLINRTAERREVELAPSAQLRTKLGRWMAWDAVTGDALPFTDKTDLPARTAIEPHGSALVFLGTPVSPREAEGEIEHADEAVARWSKLGAETKVLRALLSRARDHLKSGYAEKAYALARSVTHGLALKTDARYENGVLKIQTKAWSADGRASGARVRTRLVPGPFAWHTLEETHPGVYRLQISEDKLPHFYNSSTERYALIQGMTQIVLDASLGDRRGGGRATISLR